MNCRDIQKFVYVYLDEEFDKRESLEFEAHVSACSECRNRVREEEHFRLRLRNQFRHQQAPAALRERIQLALDTPELAVASANDEAVVVGLRPHRVWMGGALAAGLAAIAVWSGTSTNTAGLSPIETLAPAQLSTWAPLAPSRAGTAAADPLDETIEDTASVAVQLHQRDLPLDVQGDREAVDRFLTDHLGGVVVPPIPESCTTRLLGARIVAADTSPVVQFIYDHNGRRLSALQRLLPQSEPKVMHMHRVLRRHGYNTIVFGQTESLVTTVVTDLPSTDLDHLVVAGGYSR